MNREIVAENLVKQYGTFDAVRSISFRVDSGEIFGFLGPNGAGKSTTVSMLTTLSLPTRGKASVGGYDIATQAGAVRNVTGVALQEIGLDPLMKSMELLTIQGQAFGMTRKQAQDRGRELLGIVKLDSPDVIERRVGKYSGGMRRRLDLALALVHEPRILFLDEPTTGLDPASRRDIWAEVRRLNQTLGMTIFLTTQYLEEVDELASRIAIINDGEIVAEGTPAALKASMGSESINIRFREPDAVQKAASVLETITKRTQIDGETLRLYVDNAAASVQPVVNLVQASGLELHSLTMSQPTLDDVFLTVTGKRLESQEEKPAEVPSGFNRRAS